MEKFQFPSMIEKLKQSPKTIVFTEGTDARILEAAAELLKDSFLKPILVGSEAEVKAAADKSGFNIAGADIVDPANYGRHGGQDGGAAQGQDDRGGVQDRASEG